MLARSRESMSRAIYVYQDEVRYIEPKEAILFREKGMYEGHTLYCENYIKCGCSAELAGVNNEKKKVFKLKNSYTKHSPNCRYFVDEKPIVERMKGGVRGKNIVIKIDDDDIFESSLSEKNKNVQRNNGKRSGSGQSKKGGRNRYEYIKSVTELIDLIHSEDQKTVKHVYRHLYQQNMFYNRKQFDDLWNKRPQYTIMVEGFLTEWDTNRLDKKGFVYIYPDKGSSVKLMLIHNDKGEKRFKDTLHHLMNWMKKRENESRKLAIIKGNIQGFYEETKIIKFHVKDIDIKYRKHKFQYNDFAKQIEGESMVKKTLSSKNGAENIDVRSEDFLFKYVSKDHIENMREGFQEKIPLRKWFTYIHQRQNVLVPAKNIVGIDNDGRRKEENWLKQFYSLDRINNHLKMIQDQGVKSYREFMDDKTGDSIELSYYEGLDVYFVESGIHRTVTSKVFNLEQIRATVNVFKPTGELGKMQNEFQKKLYELKQEVEEMGLKLVYDQSTSDISIYNENEIIMSIPGFIYPTLYEIGMERFEVWHYYFERLKKEADNIKKRSLLLRKILMSYKKITKSQHESEYHRMLEIIIKK